MPDKLVMSDKLRKLLKSASQLNFLLNINNVCVTRKGVLCIKGLKKEKGNINDTIIGF
jgi:hypothetical protein